LTVFTNKAALLRHSSASTKPRPNSIKADNVVICKSEINSSMLYRQSKSSKTYGTRPKFSIQVTGYHNLVPVTLLICHAFWYRTRFVWYQ